MAGQFWKANNCPFQNRSGRAFLKATFSEKTSISLIRRSFLICIHHFYPLARRFALMAVFVCTAGQTVSFCQWIGKQTDCYEDAIRANPNRPTVSNPAHVTQYGVLELEYGWDHYWLEQGVRQESMSSLLKFGVLCDIELRWTTNPLLSQTDGQGTHRTFGDNWLGTEIRLHRQTKRLPTLAFSYALKLPSASTEDGLGTGKVDHFFTLAASEQAWHLNFDINATQYLIARPNTRGFDLNQQVAIALSRPLHGRLQFSGEFYGNTRLNDTTPGFVSSLWALSYTLLPRLVIDGGFEAGLTSGGPHRHVFAGFTYSIAELYRAGRRRNSRSSREANPASATD
jgi:hypothetical protein